MRIGIRFVLRRFFVNCANRIAAVRIRQMVRTLNAQFCRVPDCVLRTSGANQNIMDNLNHVLASSPRLARLSLHIGFESVQYSPEFTAVLVRTLLRTVAPDGGLSLLLAAI